MTFSSSGGRGDGYYHQLHEARHPYRLPHLSHLDYDHLYTPVSALSPAARIHHRSDLTAAAFADALALLNQLEPPNLHASIEQLPPPATNTARILPHTTSAYTPLPSDPDEQQRFSTPGGYTAPPYPGWMSQPGMNSPAAHNFQALRRRGGSHQRTPSASTVASNGPASPYTQNWAYPQIASTDFAPHSPADFADQANYSNFGKQRLAPPAQFPIDTAYLSAGYVPSAAAHTGGGAHQAMKGFAIDYHNGEDFGPEIAYSMSSNGHESPTTPQSGSGDSVSQNGQYSMPQNDYRPSNPNVQLFRTESQAYQDELYNPPTTTYNSTPATTKTSSNLLSPHRNLVSERLNTANIARSQSPTSAVSRERSPFRDGSPLAPAGAWRSPAGQVGTAAGMRQQQKEQADQAELAQHRPQLKREPTKTISPKDALLDYNEQEQQVPLFSDSIPPGYKQHTGATTEQWQNNSSSFYGSQPGVTFGSLPSGAQQWGNFRATSADGYTGGGDSMNHFQNLPPHPDPPAQIPNGGSFGNFSFPRTETHLDANPQFPAQLTSMESSASDHAPPGSQGSDPGTVPIQRPTDTRAGTGTFTCTYHGCTQRFGSYTELSRHKRESHRTAAQHSREVSASAGGTGGNGGTSSAASTSSPRNSEDRTGPTASDDPDEPLDDPDAIDPTSGLTSAALAARNSQTGPHKCTRINPSTNKPCNTIFSRPYDLTRHEDTIHNNRKQKVRCPMCREEKTFSRNDALTRHMRVVHPEVESWGKRGAGKRV
ncbi:hypothetical protein KC332_g14621 [Hortaea werneckii]|uniref:C2H2-type domain-containing protein n=1 Tax=Hortaea werneckii EXF-2000 TaxID=1157616 RepID=A0A1Z5T1X1_HORWE|nr:hypothetical protein KC350_g10733 [Hortaea werneckii]OTA29108.1 hypothetical protein BTJ68_09832 [Hortaea werneckii EXF-2000]KAI6939074.1 hypothetical protein KC341_g4434 [Hortaea werneckii]KAI7027845.1 hypothetical protein KC362_g11130 [Hortaea werneckii]KAI7050498.1 hypothetical protein KC366_g1136 [Hortaea werneckii]